MRGVSGGCCRQAQIVTGVADGDGAGRNSERVAIGNDTDLLGVLPPYGVVTSRFEASAAVETAARARREIANFFMIVSFTSLVDLSS